MKFTFLGTSSALPTKSRHTTALALAMPQSSHWSLIDCGEGTQHRILYTPLSLPRLNLVLITHLHGDHCYGLPGLLASRSMMQPLKGEDHRLTLVGPKGLKPLLTAVLAHTQLNLDFPLEIVEIPSEGTRFETREFCVSAVPLSHTIDSFAYVIDEHPHPGKFDVTRALAAGIPPGPHYQQLKEGGTVTLEDGRQFHGQDFVGEPHPGQRVIVGGDNDKPELLSDHLAHASLLIHEATHTEETLRHTNLELKHSTAQRVAQVAQRGRLPNLILTHFSARFGDKGSTCRNTVQEIEEEARSVYSGRLFLADDFAQFELSRSGELKRLDGCDSK